MKQLYSIKELVWDRDNDANCCDGHYEIRKNSNGMFRLYLVIHENTYDEYAEELAICKTEEEAKAKANELHIADLEYFLNKEHQ